MALFLSMAMVLANSGIGYAAQEADVQEAVGETGNPDEALYDDQEIGVEDFAGAKSPEATGSNAVMEANGSNISFCYIHNIDFNGLEEQRT